MKLSPSQWINRRKARRETPKEVQKPKNQNKKAILLQQPIT